MKRETLLAVTIVPAVDPLPGSRGGGITAARSRAWLAASAVGLAAWLAAGSAVAQTYWRGGTTNWGTASNWSASLDGSSNGSVPGTGTTVVFSASSVTTGPTVIAGADLTAGILQFNGNGAGETTIRGDGTLRTLVLHGTGTLLSVAAGAGPVGIGVGGQLNLRINNNGTFSNNSASLLTINNSILRSIGVTQSRVLTITGSGDTAIQGSIQNGGVTGSGELQLAKTGSGTLTLAGLNSSMGSGTLTLGSGTLNHGYIRLASNNALGAYTGVNLPASTTGIGGLQLSGGVTINKSLTTAGRSNSESTGYVLRNISGNNTWDGSVTINNVGGTYGFISDAGTLTLGQGVTVSTVVDSTRTLRFAGAGDFSVAGFTLGTSNMDVNMNGTGTLTISAASTNTGPTTIAAGTLVAGHADALGSSGTISFTGGTLQFSASNSTDYSSRFSTAAGQAYRLDTAGQTVTLATPLTSSGGTLHKFGTGTLSLTAANTFVGTTTIATGTLALGSDGALASAAIDVAAGARFDVSSLAGAFAVGSSQELRGAGTILGSLLFGADSKLAFASSLAVDSGTVSFSGFGIDDIVGLDGTLVNEGTYTLLGGTATFDLSGALNVGFANRADIGGGKEAYFNDGSLQVIVVPEPGCLLVAGVGIVVVGAGLARSSRRPTACRPS